MNSLEGYRKLIIATCAIISITIMGVMGKVFAADYLTALEWIVTSFMTANAASNIAKSLGKSQQ